jgi:Na+-transporting methylmalonyl-CoA/oxaloacetate decarboxylase gamma subunit
VRARAQRGQAAVELALVLPVLALLALALVQVGLVVRDQVRVTFGAREGARQAAVEDDEGAVRRAVTASTRLGGHRLDVDVGDRGQPGSRVTVRVAYRAPTDLPLVGRLVGDVHLEGVATMRVER